MKCSLCKQNGAIIHIQEHSDDNSKTIHLCLECAIINGFNIRPEEMNDFFYIFLNNVFNNISSKRKKNVKSKKKLKCSTCETSLDDITTKKQVGCKNCFLEFRDLIDIILYSENNSLEYKGRLPQKLVHIREYKIKINDLRRKLNQYIALEDFINAAEVRDEIKKIKTKLYREKNVSNR